MGPENLATGAFEPKHLAAQSSVVEGGRRILQAVGLNSDQLAWGAGIFALSLIGSMAAAGIVIVRLPSTYFHIGHTSSFWEGRPGYLRWTGRIAKNLLGVFLVLLGVVLSLPGVPGQGLLTILIGVLLIDFPGKRSLERRIIRMPRILHVINRLRARFGRAPLTLDSESGDSGVVAKNS